MDKKYTFPDRHNAPRTQPRARRAKVEPVSQIHLTLDFKEGSVFEMARSKILEFVDFRGAAPLPKEAKEGLSFSHDVVGARRAEGVAINDPHRYWALRFDDADKEVADRSWVIETALSEDTEREVVLFGMRLQCIARRENPPYIRTIPSFVRKVVTACDAQLDGRPVSLTPWLVDTDAKVDSLVKLLRSKERSADVVVVSLLKDSRNPKDELISSKKLAQDLAGAAHVVVITGPATYHLTEEVGQDFSVFMGAVRTYRPGFNPDAESPFAHPLGVAHRILNWDGDGGPEAHRKFLVSKILQWSVERSGNLETLRSFAETKRADAELKRQQAKAAGSDAEKLLSLADEVIEELKAEIVTKKQETDKFREEAGAKHKSDRAEIYRLRSTLQHMQERIKTLVEKSGGQQEPDIPVSLTDLKKWSDENLAGFVEIHNRALRDAKGSQYKDVALIYKSLLLLRDYYVPMRREGGLDLKQAFEQHCQELGVEKAPTGQIERLKEQGDVYRIDVRGKPRYMDLHLKKGTSPDQRKCFRLYFLWDEENDLVVVGSLPAHLKSRAT